MHACRFVGQRLEHHRQLEHREQTLRAMGEANQLDVAPLFANGFHLGDQHPDARTVDTGDATEIDHDPHTPAFDELVDLPAKGQVSIV